ncbi:hypothetical protein LXL04_038235 [Taraxacum kok-saghyz]
MSDDEGNHPKLHPTDRVYGITNIKSYVPLVLDLDRLNYDSWKELFKTHCLGYSVYDHLIGDDSEPDDPEWETIDNIVKQWIYGTLSQTVLQAILKPDSTAASVWQTIEQLFHENKDAKAMELDDELRNLSIGDLGIIEYCNKVKSIYDLLTNIGSPVSQRNLVIYTINGLSPKYAHIATTIRHKDPFPTFLEMRSMLSLEERTMLKDQTRMLHPSHQDSSSYPTVLNTEHQKNGGCGSQNPGRGGGRNTRGGGRSGRNGHGGGRGRSSNGGNTTSQQAGGWGGPTPWPQAFLAAGQPPYQPNTWPFFPPSDQPTALPQAFSTMSLQDPHNAEWFMDTGATAHLHNDTGILKSFSNTCSFSDFSVLVGNGSRIPVTKSGHSTLGSNPFRTLHLKNILITPQIIKNLVSVRKFTRDNKCSIKFDEFGFSVKDFRTKQTLLRCDSTGDLYPVTSSSPQACLSVNSSTWHQRLGHPSDPFSSDPGIQKMQIRIIFMESLVLESSLKNANSDKASALITDICQNLCSAAKSVGNSDYTVVLRLIPAGDTEFAKDASFGYKSSNLREGYNGAASDIWHDTYHLMKQISLTYTEDLDINFKVSSGLVEIVRRIKTSPCYILANGGITSSDIATKALEAKHAKIVGQALAGFFRLPISVANPSLKAFSDGLATEMAVAESPDSSSVRNRCHELFRNEFATDYLLRICLHSSVLPTSPTPTTPSAAPPSATNHPMTTRLKDGIRKPVTRLNLHTATSESSSPLPKSYSHAFRDPNWLNAMKEEYHALISNGTWELVPRPANVNIVNCIWLFKKKFNADDSLARYKARLVANGCSQRPSIDCDETFC